MTFQKKSYTAGQRAAFEKFASDADTMISLLGAASPAAAGVGAGFTAPEGYGVGHAARTGAGALAGSTVGESGGEAAGALLARLLKQDPQLFERIGGQLGKRVGGGLGAHAGNVWAQDSTMKDMQKKQMGG